MSLVLALTLVAAPPAAFTVLFTGDVAGDLAPCG
jgi:hypothetical protein